MTTDLPAGTVTFLFTDIEGSTPLWEREPGPMRAALAQHDAILQQAVAAHHGVHYKTIGDAIQAAFALPADALAAALAAQRELGAAGWPTSLPLRVRMGLHTGPAEPAGADYATTHTLNRVARIMAAAHGGQIVLSAETAELLRGYLPADSRVKDLGQHRMKGMAQREHLFQLVVPDLPSEFSLLATLEALPNNLPIQLTSFVGRERELAEARHLLAETRLLTLTGSGGTGKTRLSLQIAAESLPDYPNGAWLVELAPLAGPAYLVPALAAVFDVREQPGRPLAETVTDYLRAKHLLLLLDNCEHLIDACAHLADDLLHACAGLRIIASSREALGLAGETAYRVPSLALPPTGTPTPEALAGSEAARLFVERAQAAQPRFALTERNAPAVAAICRRLDGIPLALELAAARVRVLSVEQILSRLDDRFRLLVGGSRTALPRQQTLRALIDWSYDLLPDDERRLLRLLSVFAGGATLEAVEAVGKVDEGPLRATKDELIRPSSRAAVLRQLDVLDLLAQLVNKSLVAVEEDGPLPPRNHQPHVSVLGSAGAGGGNRYRLLETIRQYAREKLLDAAGDDTPPNARGAGAAEARNRHLEFFLHLTEDAEPQLMGAEMMAALDRLETEQDNLRAALEWAMDPDHGDSLAALRLVAVLHILWGRRTSVTEGRQWVQTALARAETAQDAAEPAYLAAQARALVGAAELAFQAGDNPAALVAAKASMAVARQIGASRTLALALVLGATASAFAGDLVTAQAWAEECVALSRQHGYRYELGYVAGAFMSLALAADKPVPLGLREETVRAARASGNPVVIGLTIQNVARAAAMSGDWDEAYAGFEEAATLFHQMRGRSLHNSSRSEIGHLLRKQGRYHEASAVYVDTMRVWQELGQRPAMAHELECLAFIAAATGQTERAAVLFGAAEALREALGTPMTAYERREYDQGVAQLRAQTDEAALTAAWARGRALTLDEALACALAEGAG